MRSLVTLEIKSDQSGVCQPISQMTFHVSANLCLIPSRTPGWSLCWLGRKNSIRSRFGLAHRRRGCLAMPLPAAVVEILLDSVTGLITRGEDLRTTKYRGAASGHERRCISRQEE